MKIIAMASKISPAEPDLYLWYSKTGKVLKNTVFSNQHQPNFNQKLILLYLSNFNQNPK